MEQKFALGKSAEKTNKIWFTITKSFLILSVIFSVLLNFSNVLNKYDKKSIVFKDEADFQNRLENAKNNDELQELMDARISQRAYELKYGKQLSENEINNYDQNPAKKWGGIIGSLIGGIIFGTIGLFILKFLFRPLRNNFLNFQKLQKSEITNAEYQKNKNFTIINTLIITLLFLIPTFGIILSLTFYQLRFTLKT
ncbi:hypothetical protein PG279_10025 [Riemerella anatipestifer]|nr:hypothetical protein [Riemerella anatipestifer]MDY3339508.1 hypothetical protein [Riemerella anatipestifer]